MSLAKIAEALAAAPAGSPEEAILAAELKRASARQEANEVQRQEERESVAWTAHFARIAEQERAVKHADILPLCVAAREKYEDAVRENDAVNLAVAHAGARLNVAMARLNAARSSRPDQNRYPSPAALKKSENEIHAAEKMLEEAKQAMREANVRQGQAMADLFTAHEQFSTVAFRERMLRPAQQGR